MAGGSKNTCRALKFTSHSSESKIPLWQQVSSAPSKAKLPLVLKSMNLFNQAGLLLTKVYQDDYCHISVANNQCCIYQFYNRLPASRELLKPSMEIILSLAKIASVSAVAVFYLLEVEEGQLLPSEDITWVRKDVIPQLADAGIQFVAYVSQNNLFRRFSQDNMISSDAKKSLSLRVFQDREEALIWLRQVQEAR